MAPVIQPQGIRVLTLDGSDGRDVVHRSGCTTVEPTDS